MPKKRNASKGGSKSQKKKTPKKRSKPEKLSYSQVYPSYKRKRKLYGTTTEQQKKEARAERQRDYVREVNKAIDNLQHHIPYLKGRKRRVSHAKVIYSAIEYILHLRAVLAKKPTNDFEETVNKVLMRRTEVKLEEPSSLSPDVK